jgi:LmbE family N-acetylglucosaminyl deacetylase
MTQTRRLLCILAHPDDESLGLGGTLARYASEGAQTCLITATRGQRGWPGPPDAYPGGAALGRIREGELRQAAAILGLHETILLDYMDGDLDQADHALVVAQLAAQVRRIRPQVVVTFDPYGYYGHPDHIAISQWATAAIMAAADPAFAPGDAPHGVDKLYYRVPTISELELYQAAFGALAMPVDGVERRAVPWPDWAVTTRIDTRPYWPQTWEAILCHRSQLAAFDRLSRLTDEQKRHIFSSETFYRVFSRVNSGRLVEDDLFAGLALPVPNTRDSSAEVGDSSQQRPGSILF